VAWGQYLSVQFRPLVVVGKDWARVRCSSIPNLHSLVFRIERLANGPETSSVVQDCAPKLLTSPLLGF
jgi:hypothetical protein